MLLIQTTKLVMVKPLKAESNLLVIICVRPTGLTSRTNTHFATGAPRYWICDWLWK